MIENVTLLLLIITPLRIRLSIRLYRFNYTIQLDCKKAYAQELKPSIAQGYQHLVVCHDMDGTHDVIEDVNTTSIYDYIVNQQICWMTLQT